MGLVVYLFLKEATFSAKNKDKKPKKARCNKTKPNLYANNICILSSKLLKVQKYVLGFFAQYYRLLHSVWFFISHITNVSIGTDVLHGR